ncbi:unnamed protein product [Parnassius mnemosyne]|uniref:Uncharacterized protein n=1 Tax=Parnassius mnemosyne TaxID=213953 RepID=A0AAV1L9R7_9NEOP
MYGGEKKNIMKKPACVRILGMKRSITPDIMDSETKNRPISPSLLRPTRYNIKEDKNKARLRVQTKSECCATYINDDRRNEYFAQLLTEELKYINPCMKTRCYIKILNFLNEVKNYHTNQIEVTDTERI